MQRLSNGECALLGTNLLIRFYVLYLIVCLQRLDVIFGDGSTETLQIQLLTTHRILHVVAYLQHIPKVIVDLASLLLDSPANREVRQLPQVWQIRTSVLSVFLYMSH